MKEEDLKKIIEARYNIVVEAIEKIKGVYKVQADKERYCLKIVNYNEAHFLFILGAIKHLKERYFKTIPLIINTVEGFDYINLEDRFAYLTLWIEGRESSYDNPIDLYMAARKLGEFHNASEGFIVEDYMEPRVGWFKWIEVYRTRKNEILDFKYRILEKSSKNQMDLKYLSMVPKELENCDRAIENLCSSGYDKKMLKEIKTAGFCHHDYAHHNVLIAKDGVTIIDFDYCILDVYLHDLSSLLLRAMNHGRWSEKRMKIILDAYRSEHRLLSEDFKIMAAFMEFPQDFWQRGLQYYWEYKPWTEEFYIKKLNDYEEDNKNKQDFIEYFKNLDLSNL